MSANLAYINPDIISWARKQRGASYDQLATSQLKAEQIKAWEERKGLPTHAQAEALANKLRIPYLMLFLSQPPDMSVPIPDLRTVGGEPISNASPEFMEIINRAMVRQDWYRNIELANNDGPLPFVAKFALGDDIATVARDIRKTLQLDQGKQSIGWRTFLEHFISNVEAIGILVFRSAIVRHATNRKLTVQEFRGFALSDPWAPVIFINDDDAKAAQIFTLAHEVVHIWIGETGVSDPRLKKRSSEFVNAIERFCNRVAAEILTPESDFRREWKSGLSLMVNVNQLAAHFHVSSLVVLIRAHDLETIADQDFSKAFDSELERFRRQDKKEKAEEEKKAKKRGGNFWASFVIRNSRKFTDMVVRSAREGQQRYTDAASLLDIKAATLERYISKIGSS